MEAVVDQLLSHQKVYSARCSAGRGRTHGGRTITRRLQVPTKPFFLPFLPKAEMEAMVEEGVRLALEHEMHVTMERNRKQEELRQALCAGKPIKVRSFAVFVLTPIAHLSPCFPAKPRTLWVYREHIARLPRMGRNLINGCTAEETNRAGGRRICGGGDACGSFPANRPRCVGAVGPR